MNAGALEGVGIVIVNYGSAALIRQNVANGELVRSGASVHVVDNLRSASDRDEMRALAEANAWSLLEPSTNLGFGAGVDLGVADAQRRRCDTFLLLNPDATIDAAGLADLVRQVREDPMTAVSPLIVRPDGSVAFRGSVVDVERARTRSADGSRSDLEHPWLAGACIVIHDELWRAVGGYGGDYFLYWEDVDLGWRCVAAGGGVVVRPDVVAVHSVGGTQGENKSLLYYYWNCRNRLLFAAQHLGARDRLRWALRTVPYAVEVVSRGGRRQLLHPAPVWAAVRGSIAGLRLLASGTVPAAAAPRTSVEGATTS